MTSNRDIYITANSLIAHHGPNAYTRTAAHHQAMVDREDREGMAVWKCIRRAVRELLAVEPGVGEGVH